MHRYVYKVLFSILIFPIKILSNIFVFIFDYIYVVFPERIKKEYKFIRLKNWAMNEYKRSNYEVALNKVDELLVLSEDFKSSWNYGNSIHWGHTIRGLIFYRRSEYEKAIEELMLSAKIKTSPQLEAFGPMMELANLCKDKFSEDIVAQYLKLFHKNLKKH